MLEKSYKEIVLKIRRSNKKIDFYQKQILKGKREYKLAKEKIESSK